MTDYPTERPALTRALLAAAVREATGLPGAQPRPGQLLLVDDLAAAADATAHAIGVAPTGVGKSLSALSVAAAGAILDGERWLISTESIALQAQYVDKDGPVIDAAARAVAETGVTVAQLKGWSNYVCAVKMRSVAEEITGERQPHNVTKAADALPDGVAMGDFKIDGRDVNGKQLMDLLRWSFKQHADDDAPGDRGHYPGVATDAEWQQVAVTPSECVGANDCPLASICKPVLARDKAAAADIVVTNHSMLAVQAAAGVPVVVGNANLGPFAGIIVDEAHALPGVVRSQGQSEVSGRRIHQVVRAVLNVASDRDRTVRSWADDGTHVAESLEDLLRAAVKPGQTVKVKENADPVAGDGDLIDAWLKRGGKIVSNVTKSGSGAKDRIAANRAASAVDSAARDLNAVRKHIVGVARWYELVGGRQGGREWAAVQAAPVAVGGLMARNLYTERIVEDGEELERPLAVGAVSATLPEGFAREAGLAAVIKRYPSPFDAAYGSSMLYVPRAVDAADVDAITGVNRWSNRPSFDTGKHADWAAQLMRKLVDANGGSALVLSSTVSAGKMYAAELRKEAAGRFKVYSQWDGENVRVITAKWRDDPTAVMVGTRSLMTGVDAPGETCTLVIIDRAPRSASNPVDDARVESLTEALGDKWAADRLVYVADAALLLEQAVGRLIRSMGDSGMAAVLDPRMLNAGPYKYQTPTRNTYQRAFERFQQRTSHLDAALAFLRSRPAGDR